MNKKTLIFLIIFVAVLITLGLFIFSNSIQKPEQPIISQPTIPPVLPDLSNYSEEELIKLWANGERCPETKIGFSVPAKPEDWVTVGGVKFVVNIVEVNFTDDATCEDAEQIAILLNGRIKGFGPVTNLYGIEIFTRTPEALEAAIQKVEALDNPKIEGVFRAVALTHGEN